MGTLLDERGMSPLRGSLGGGFRWFGARFDAIAPEEEPHQHLSIDLAIGRCEGPLLRRLQRDPFEVSTRPRTLRARGTHGAILSDDDADRDSHRAANRLKCTLRNLRHDLVERRKRHVSGMLHFCGHWLGALGNSDFVRRWSRERSRRLFVRHNAHHGSGSGIAAEHTRENPCDCRQDDDADTDRKGERTLIELRGRRGFERIFSRDLHADHETRRRRLSRLRRLGGFRNCLGLVRTHYSRSRLTSRLMIDSIKMLQHYYAIERAPRSRLRSGMIRGVSRAHTRREDMQNTRTGVATL